MNDARRDCPHAADADAGQRVGPLAEQAGVGAQAGNAVEVSRAGPAQPQYAGALRAGVEAPGSGSQGRENDGNKEETKTHTNSLAETGRQKYTDGS
jgi:hypothetical protein